MEAAFEAASCVEACLLGACRPTSRVCRSIKRGVAAVDIGKAVTVVNWTWSRQEGIASVAKGRIEQLTVEMSVCLSSNTGILKDLKGSFCGSKPLGE